MVLSLFALLGVGGVGIAKHQLLLVTITRTLNPILDASLAPRTAKITLDIMQLVLEERFYI